MDGRRDGHAGEWRDWRMNGRLNERTAGLADGGTHKNERPTRKRAFLYERKTVLSAGHWNLLSCLSHCNEDDDDKNDNIMTMTTSVITTL